MKTLLGIIILLALLSTTWAEEEKPGPSVVVVTNLTVVLPSEDAQRAKFLWNQFANKPEEEQFASYGTKDWKQNFKSFADALVEKAQTGKMDADSLQKVLEKIRSSAGELAYLPVGAYQTSLNNDPIWIVVVKWEIAESDASLGHVRIFAYDQKTLKQVGFETCM
ncbi:MAG: hypothetical protein HY343_08025 [Lentisphaerae bacterium]|nr:hypothetical protein [Lentisphaerota bacterium]